MLVLGGAGAGAFEPISGLSGDWNEDGHTDLVVILRGDDDTADLVLFEGDDEDGLSEVLRLDGAIYAGTLAGQLPRLTPRGPRGFVISQEQTAVSRNPWTLDLTIAHRPHLGGYVVAGYTFHMYDRLLPGAGAECDINLLTGSFARHHAPGEDPAEVQLGTVDPAPLPLSDLTLDWRPAICDFP